MVADTDSGPMMVNMIGCNPLKQQDFLVRFIIAPQRHTVCITWFYRVRATIYLEGAT